MHKRLLVTLIIIIVIHVGKDNQVISTDSNSNPIDGYINLSEGMVTSKIIVVLHHRGYCNPTLLDKNAMGYNYPQKVIVTMLMIIITTYHGLY